MCLLFIPLPLIFFLSSSSAYVVAPQSPLVPQTSILEPLPITLFSSPFVVPKLYLTPTSSLFPEKGPLVSPVSTRNVTLVEEAEKFSTRIGKRNVDLCYFLGQDIFTSHVACNKNWADGTAEGVRRYINELTFEANRVLGKDNLRLVWKGPYERHDATERYPSDPTKDVLTASQLGCDAVVFLVFNEFSQDCSTATHGHKYGGIAQGGMCEASQGSGYSVIVDQGFMEDAWTGPQILAHHLLKMLIADLPVQERTCPNKDSLLYPQLFSGKQKVDQCVVDKLNRSQVSQRACLQD